MSGVVLVGKYAKLVLPALLMLFPGVYVLIALSFWNFPAGERTIQGQALQCVV